MESAMVVLATPQNAAPRQGRDDASRRPAEPPRPQDGALRSAARRLRAWLADRARRPRWTKPAISETPWSAIAHPA